MVSLCNDKNGTRRIVFDDATGARHTLRLGKVAKSIAESVRGHIRNLRKARFFGGTVPDSTTRWLNEIDPTLRDRIAELGLIIDAAEEKSKGEKLGPFLDAHKYYSRAGAILQGGTKLVRDQTARNLLAYFTAEKYLVDIDSVAAFAFRDFLLETEELVESTARKRCSVASTLFAFAFRRALIPMNPFAEVPKAPMAGDNGLYISHDVAAKVLAKFDDSEERLLFGLSRWGGLRIGSEVRKLRWRDVDWAGKRFTVHAPKTIRHKPTRIVPMFPELVPLFEARLADTDGLDEMVLPYLQARTDTAIRSRLDRAIKAAGLKEWARPWQNLRASRQTDLAHSYPIHVVCEWLGNSKPVAEKHYLMTTEADYQRATEGKATPPVAYTAPSSKTESARNAARSSGAEACTENPQKVPVSKNPGKSGPQCIAMQPGA